MRKRAGTHDPAKDQREPKPCPSCKQPIIYAHRRYEDDSASHAVLPVDYLPSEQGTWVLTYRAGWNWLLFEKFDEAKHAGRRRYMGHFATCPMSPLWRKKKKRRLKRGRREMRKADSAG